MHSPEARGWAEVAVYACPIRVTFSLTGDQGRSR
jgi:hypothetical protein